MTPGSLIKLVDQLCLVSARCAHDRGEVRMASCTSARADGHATRRISSTNSAGSSPAGSHRTFSDPLPFSNAT